MSPGRHPDNLAPRAVVRGLMEALASLHAADVNNESLAVRESIVAAQKELRIAIRRAQLIAKDSDLRTAEQTGLF